MKFIFIYIIFSLICQLCLGRENPIMENTTSRMDKEYMEGVIPSAPEYVIPPVLMRTLYEDMHPEDRWLFAKTYSQDPEVASRMVAAQIAVYCWQQADIEDHLGSEHFIALSLYELWQKKEGMSLLWYDRKAIIIGNFS